MQELTKQANILRNKAFEIISFLDLKKLLSSYGDVYIVGSVELDLMTWRDIDIEVICKENPSKSNAMDIARDIFTKEGVRKVSPVDYSDSDGIKKPKGLYVGSEYTDENRDKWKIDIWLLTKDSARTKDVTENLKRRITHETRNSILTIKSQLNDNPKYRKEITSMDIYNSVLDNQVSDFKGFTEYLTSIGKSL